MIKWTVVAAKILYGMTAIFFGCSLASASALSFLPAFSWLIVIDPESVAIPFAKSFPRMLLAWLAVMETMWAFPVAGSQQSLSTVLPMLLAIVSMCDGLETLIDSTPRNLGRAAAVATGATVLLIAGLPFTSFYTAIDKHYLAGASNCLPGAERLRMPAAQTEEYEILAANLAAASDTFIITDGLNIMYFWTGKRPPSTIVLSHAISWYSDREQYQMIADLAHQHPKACVVIRKPVQDPETYQNFFSYIESDFKPWFRTANAFVFVRNDRELPECKVPPGYRQHLATPHSRPR